MADTTAPKVLDRKTLKVLKTAPGVSGIVVRVALVEGGHTFYARFGDIFGYLCVAITFFMWLLWPRLRRRRTGARQVRKQ